MSIRSIAVVVVAVFAVTMCYSLPMNNEHAPVIGINGLEPFSFHVQIEYPIKRHQRYCYGVLLSEEYIAAPVYDCIDDFKVGEKNHIINQVESKRDDRIETLRATRKQYSKLYNSITLARNIGVIKVNEFTEFNKPIFMKYDQHLPHASAVVTYGFGSLFSTGNTELQKAESITVTRLRARIQYPVKVHQNYTVPVEVNKAAIKSLDIGSPIVYNEEALVGLIVYADENNWDQNHKTIILGTELCKKTIADAIKDWTKLKFCPGQTIQQ